MRSISNISNFNILKIQKYFDKERGNKNEKDREFKQG